MKELGSWAGPAEIKELGGWENLVAGSGSKAGVPSSSGSVVGISSEFCCMADTGSGSGSVVGMELSGSSSATVQGEPIDQHQHKNHHSQKNSLEYHHWAAMPGCKASG